MTLEDEVQSALTWLERRSTKHDRENLARFGISASKAFCVSMANMKLLARRLGRNHELAAALWGTGWYEARMLASLIDQPARVTPAQMDAAARKVGRDALRELTSPAVTRRLAARRRASR
jgi:3-methyladenine DNA glycosylase AlkD